MLTPKSLRLQYFNIEGPAEKSRLALSLAKIPFTDDRVNFDQWPSLKPNTKYGSLPLMHIDDGAHVLAQSDAILRYVGRCANAKGIALYPEENQLEIDEALSLVDDLNQNWGYCLYIGMNPGKLGHAELVKDSPEHVEVTKRMREKWVAEEWPRYAEYFDRRFKQTKFMCGDEVSIADCALIPFLRRLCSGGLDHVPKDCVDKFPTIKAYYDRFHTLPEVAAWYAPKA